MQHVSFGCLEAELAKNYVQGTPTEEDRAQHMLEIMRADAWDECNFKLGPFLLTYIYEFLPSLLSQFLVCAIEGKQAAVNRQLLYPASVSADIEYHLQWPYLVGYLVFQPPCVSPLDVALIFLLMSFRAACIAMRYAYSANSDLRLIQGFSKWKEMKFTPRTIGLGTHYDIAGAYNYDVMREIMVSALRANVLSELPRQRFTVSPQLATRVWEEVKQRLESIDSQPEGNSPCGPAVRASKFGDLQLHIGLLDTDQIEEEVSQGHLRASVVVYFFATRGYAPSPKWWFPVTFYMSYLMALIALLLHFFATDSCLYAGPVVYVLAVFRFIAYGQCFSLYATYLSYPILDAWKRNELCQAVLASIGHPQVKGDRLLAGRFDVPLPLCSPEDILAFWLVQRVLGPELYRGQAVRYNSAYVVVAIVHLAAMWCLLGLVSCNSLGLDPSSAAEVIMLLVVGVPSLCAATLLASKCNSAIKQTQRVLSRASLDAVLKRPDEKDAIIELAGLLAANIEEVTPVQICYMPATTEILSLIWVALTYLSQSVGRQLQGQLNVDIAERLCVA